MGKVWANKPWAGVCMGVITVGQVGQATHRWQAGRQVVIGQ